MHLLPVCALYQTTRHAPVNPAVQRSLITYVLVVQAACPEKVASDGHQVPLSYLNLEIT